MDYNDTINNVKVYGLEESIKASKYPMSIDTKKCNYDITDRVKSLGSVDTGTGHDNFLKGIIVQFDWTFTPKCSVEAERYHFIDFVSSQSTMHRITKFDLDKAYIDHQSYPYGDIQIINLWNDNWNAYYEDKQNFEANEK